MNNLENPGMKLVPEADKGLEISQENAKHLREKIDVLDKERIALQESLEKSDLSASESSEIDQKLFKIKTRMASLLEGEDRVMAGLEEIRKKQSQQGSWGDDLYANGQVR